MKDLAPRVLRYTAGLVVASVSLVVVLPRVASTPWPAVAGTLTALPLEVLAGLTVVWAAGLATHTITLTAGLPGLNHRRAILLSLTGSWNQDALFPEFD